MSEQTTDAPAAEAAQRGQITQPNPLEMIWERHKKKIIAVAVVVLGVFAGIRAWRWMERQKLNTIWGTFTSKVGWSASLAPADADANPFKYYRAESLYSPYREFGDEVRKTESDDMAKLPQELAPEAADQGRVLLASKRALDGDVQGTSEAVGTLTKAEWVTVERAWPPIYAPLPEEEEDEDGKKKTPKQKEPDEPAAASLKGLLGARSERVAAFRAEHASLYEAPKPGAKPEIAFETSRGVFKVRLYSEQAPEHCKQFLANCESGWYTEQRFHEIRRKPTDAQQSFNYQGDLVFLGDPASKDEDRSKWGTFKSEKQTPRERSGISHFPFVLAAHRHDKLGSDQRLVYFTATDCAEKRDDQYVVFGIVVDGREVIEQIATGEFNSGAEEASGSGKPANPVKIIKVTVTK